MPDQVKTSQQKFFAMIFVLAVVALVMIAAFYAVQQGFQAHDIAIMGFIAFGTVIVLFAAAVLYQIGNGSIKLRGIISEPMNGLLDKPDAEGNQQPKASLSRFQFLIFTFVVAGLLLMLSIEAGQIVDIPNNVLVLIGLSGGGFLLGKSMSGVETDAQDSSPQKPADQKDEG